YVSDLTEFRCDHDDLLVGRDAKTAPNLISALAHCRGSRQQFFKTGISRHCDSRGRKMPKRSQMLGCVPVIHQRLVRQRKSTLVRLSRELVGRVQVVQPMAVDKPVLNADRRDLASAGFKHKCPAPSPRLPLPPTPPPLP